MNRRRALTDYERQQIRNISAWLREETTPLQQAVQCVNAAVERHICGMLSPEHLATLCKAGELLLANSDHAWQHLKQRLGSGQIPVEHWQDMKDQPLEVCDRLQGSVAGAALTKAAVAALITAPLDFLGELVDVGFALLLGLKIIQEVGLCYGFGSETSVERHILWGTLRISFAATGKERQHLLLSLLHPSEENERGAIAGLLEDSAFEVFSDNTAEAVLSRALVTLSEELSGELIPMIGIALGVLESETFACQVATTARYVNQLRWLLRAHGGSGVDLACS
ncbi:hypothetical protein NIES2134_108050 [Thermostichus vulcanus NIES-2134]|nr:hypothetical protein NIES2134_108050 [Thermostichus vulcanus NIES-2134]